MTKTDLIKRYALFIVGLFIASMGVAFSTKAGLGTSPVAAVPYTVSLISPLFTFGGWLNLWSMVQIAVQILLLRKNCKPMEIAIQTVLAFAYGYMTNFSVIVINGMVVDTYPKQFLCMIVGCFILAFGIWLQFMGQVAMLPGEAMNRAISTVTGRKYENIKILFDVLYIISAVILSLIFLGGTNGLKGVREGSIIAAVVVGNIIKIYSWLWGKVTRRAKK